MPPALRAAIEINQRWVECLGGLHVHIASCPNDQEVAAIIDRHCPQPPTTTTPTA